MASKAENKILTVSGRYFDGRRSVALPASLSREGETCILHTEAGEQRFPATALKARPPLGRLARAVDFPGGARFESDDHAGMNALFAGPSLVGRLEASWRLALGGAAGLVAFLLLSYFLLLPVFSREIAAHLPAGWKTALSAPAKKAFDKSYFEKSSLSPAETARAERIFQEVAKANPGLKLELRKSPAIGANAFALPDGTIYFTDELYFLSGTDEEILAVLYHEAAHVRLNHASAEFISTSVISLALFTITGGDFSSLALALLNSRYSRAYEEEADAYAARALKAAGHSPRALGRILARMEKEKEKEKERYKYLSFLSSHPDTEARIKKLEAY